MFKMLGGPRVRRTAQDNTVRLIAGWVAARKTIMVLEDATTLCALEQCCGFWTGAGRLAGIVAVGLGRKL